MFSRCDDFSLSSTFLLALSVFSDAQVEVIIHCLPLSSTVAGSLSRRSGEIWLSCPPTPPHPPPLNLTMLHLPPPNPYPSPPRPFPSSRSASILLWLSVNSRGNLPLCVWCINVNVPPAAPVWLRSSSWLAIAVNTMLETVGELGLVRSWKSFNLKNWKEKLF